MSEDQSVKQKVEAAIADPKKRVVIYNGGQGAAHFFKTNPYLQERTFEALKNHVEGVKKQKPDHVIEVWVENKRDVQEKKTTFDILDLETGDLRGPRGSFPDDLIR